MRSTWLGQYYSNNLTKYYLFQKLVPRLWRLSYLIYNKVWIYRKSLQRQIVRLSDICGLHQRDLAVPAESLITLGPFVFKENHRGKLSESHQLCSFPEIFIAHIGGALVTSGTNLILTNHAVVAHDLYDFKRDYTSEELNGRAYIWPSSNRIAWLMTTVPQGAVSKAACFTDSCASNYAHWMTEVLPRLNLFCSIKKYAEVPLVVDDGLHTNLFDSLKIIAGDMREVIMLPKGACLHVEDLYVTSVTGYVPFERRNRKLEGHLHGVFSPKALQALRDRLLQRKSDRSSTARKVVVRRNSKVRNIVNAKKIEEVLIRHEFSVIEPELLPLTEQIAIFANADVVIGATGAAMANLIFCKPTCKIIIMISDYRDMPYWYWPNLASSVGNQIRYVFGRCVDSPAYLHSDYVIDLADLINAIQD